jgi:predicted permease
MTGVVEDFRLGARRLLKNRAFALGAVLSLALGIGANTTVFTLLNAVLLRPLPVEDPSGLAAVSTLDSRNPGQLFCSYPNYKDYRDRNQVFSSLLLYSPIAVNLTGWGEPRMVIAQIVSGNYFATLGVRPSLGRGFLPSEDAALGASPVVVISQGLWSRSFGRDPRAIGRKVEINGRPFDIVGIAPPGFQGLDTLMACDIWIPMAMYEQVYPNVAWVNQRRALLFSVAGRLKPGIGIRQAEAALNVIAADLEREYPDDNRGRRIKLAGVAEAAIDARSRPAIAQGGAVLMAIATLVLLIACGNLANLLLVSAAGRSREIAVRLALGASRWRIVRQLLVESVILGLAGGAAGLALAGWARDVLWAMRPPLLAYSSLRLDLDGRVLAYTFALAFVTAILFGLVPAWRATRADLVTDLKERAGRTASRGMRSLLVAGQLAFSVVALIGASLFMRSLGNAERVDPGFQPARLGTVTFNFAGQGYSEERGRQFLRQALESAALQPGVASVALAKDGPLTVSLARTVIVEGQPTAAGRFTLTSLISPGYLRTVGIPLLRGRDISPLDTRETPRVAVVNQAAAAYYWPGQDPLGKRLRFFGDEKPAEVVGVARNANYQAIGEQPQALIYLSMWQYYFPSAVVYVRAKGDAGTTLASVRRGLQSLDRNMWLEARSLDQAIRESLWAPRLSAWLLAMFGALGLLLAGVGIYGVMAYSINQRRREIGVRMALGATPGDVQRMVLGEGARLVASGVLAGMAISLPATQAARKLLFVTSPFDALTFAAVPVFLVVVGVGACWLPARRATKVEASRALRDE